MKYTLKPQSRESTSHFHFSILASVLSAILEIPPAWLKPVGRLSQSHSQQLFLLVQVLPIFYLRSSICPSCSKDHLIASIYDGLLPSGLSLLGPDPHNLARIGFLDRVQTSFPVGYRGSPRAHFKLTDGSRNEAIATLVRPSNIRPTTRELEYRQLRSTSGHLCSSSQRQLPTCATCALAQRSAARRLLKGSAREAVLTYVVDVFAWRDRLSVLVTR